MGHTKERRVHTRFWWGNMRHKEHFEHLGLDERVIIKWMLKKLDAKTWA
jgi:hypothetical protein